MKNDEKNGFTLMEVCVALAVLAVRVFGARGVYALVWTLFAPFRRRG